MILIIGGAYQGKLNYARNQLNIHNEGDIVNGYHNTVLSQLQNGIDPLQYARDNVGYMRNKIIISDDIFCGVVPVDPEERKWREELGRVLSYLSSEADEVYRVFCGLGTRLK